MITGINHINIAVQDINVSFKFYKEIMGFKPLCKSEGSAYFLAGTLHSSGCLWFSLDLDREKKRIPALCNSHIAFSVSEENFYEMSTRILESKCKIFKENTSPGKSLYFLDPDAHKLEIHVGNWQKRIQDKKENPGNWKNIEWFV